jgi:uncharacterized protein YuzE
MNRGPITHYVIKDHARFECSLTWTDIQQKGNLISLEILDASRWVSKPKSIEFEITS